ncbi:SDR family oxidoreductase [Bacillus sp. HMF5848]|uniref:SDR family NAD(P)-dependent oxidoreductase n=1 Tax=Bacillus sp. HMF5848 TaxID=2495421 RepID=UPI000F7AE0D7|nr:SDR family oxidoreductase [Bacillus sp. HMF5848]RSK26645.1 SDR family oxidoreductase [Bacillus sp. HMF5848]
MTKTVLITGATSGLGYEFAKLFANDGYNLVLVARNEERLKDIKNKFNNVNIFTFSEDLSQSNAAQRVYQAINQEGIQVDMLVNNAGFGLLGEFDTISIEKQHDMVQLNVTALMELTYYFLKDMKMRNQGKILNVASTAAFQPGPKMAVYYATKAFVLSFSEALVEELYGSNITVTTLCPGATKTNFGAVANVENTKMFSRAMSSEVVARQGYAAFIKGKRVVVTGGLNKMGVIASKFLPRSIAAKVAKYVAEEN